MNQPLNSQLNSQLGLASGTLPALVSPTETTESMLPVEGASQLLDNQMDSQIALHQEVLFQNDFVLKRTNGEQNEAEEDVRMPLNLDGMQPLTFSAGDEDLSINALLSGPTVSHCGVDSSLERFFAKCEYAARQQ